MKKLTFFVCELDGRNASCKNRSAPVNQPLAFCCGEVRKKGNMSVFTDECRYRSVMVINIETPEEMASAVTDVNAPVSVGEPTDTTPAQG